MRTKFIQLLEERIRLQEQGSTNAVELSRDEAKALLDFLQWLKFADMKRTLDATLES
jgi:cytochrome c